MQPNEMVTAAGHPLALHNLLHLAATACGVEVEDLKGRSHRRELVTVRRIFAKRAHSEGFSSPAIGRMINRHHTTILHLLQT